ncbi:MAG: YceI family protein [Acidobacteriota bacterium]
MTLLICTLPAAAEVRHFKIDSGQSTALFRIKMMEVSYFNGQFFEMSGQVDFDPQNPSAASIRLEIQSNSVRTGIPKLTEHLKSPDFFNATQFPRMRFQSTSVKALGEKRFEVSGELTIRGVTRPVTVEVELVGMRQGGKLMAGFSTIFTINRNDFGITYMPGGLSPDVEVRLDLHTYVP